MTLAPSNSNILSPHTVAPQIEDHWPTVFLPSDVEPFVKAGRYKFNHLEWAKALLEPLKAQSKAALESVPQLPFAPAGARYAYHSPVTGAALKFTSEHEDRYLDPTNDQWQTDRPQRRAWTLLAHWRTLCLMRTFALLARLRGNDRYLAWPLGGVKLLRDYTQFFRVEEPWEEVTYSPLYGSVTDDAAMLLLLANFHSLADPMELYEDAEREAAHSAGEHLAKTLLRVAAAPDDADELARVYAATALRVAGAAFGADHWIQAGKRGFGDLGTVLRLCLSRMPDGSTDGFLRGGSVLQHLLALPALLTYYVEEEPDDPGVELDMLLAMQAPLTLADQDLGLPTYGRYGAPDVFNLRGIQSIYELAASQLGADIYGPVLSAIVAANGGVRDLWGVVVGPNDLPEPSGLATGPSMLTANGLLVLRAAAANAPTAIVMGGQSQGPMAHADWGGIFIHAGGRPLSADPGDPGSETPTDSAAYFASAIAHNTLLLEDKAFPGEVGMTWLPDAQPPQAMLQRAAGSGLVERTVLYDPPFVVTVDSFSLTGKRLLGYTYQAVGALDAPGQRPTESEPTDPEPPSESGAWAALTGRRYLAVKPQQTQRLHWACEAGWHLGLTLRSSHAASAMLANAPGNPAQRRSDILVLRCRERSWTVVTAYEPYRGEGTLRDLAWDPKAQVVSLTLHDGSERRLVVVANPSHA